MATEVGKIPGTASAAPKSHPVVMDDSMTLYWNPWWLGDVRCLRKPHVSSRYNKVVSQAPWLLFKDQTLQNLCALSIHNIALLLESFFAFESILPLFSKPSGTRGGLFWAKPSRGLRLGFQTTMVPASQRMSNQSPAVSTCEIWNRLDVYINL